MPDHLPLHTLRRHITNWGFAHTLKIGDDEWALIDAYGDMGDINGSSKDDAYVHDWTIVYDPRTPSIFPPVTDAVSLPTGTLRCCDEGLHAIKVADGGWLGYFGDKGLVDYVDDEHVVGWAVVYVPMEDKLWARLNGLDPNPTLEAVHASVVGKP